MTPREAAGRARAELEQTEEAFRKVREAMIAQLLETPVTAALEREKLYLGVQSLEAVKAVLMNVIQTGLLEEAADQFKRAFGTD